MLGALIGAGASLIGGALASREQKAGIASMNRYNSPKAIRKRAEDAGFNPLLFVGPGVGLQNQAATGMMGSAVQDAGMVIADGLAAQSADKQRIAALQEANKKLAASFETATLRPRVGGIYSPGGPGTVQAPAIPGVANGPPPDWSWDVWFRENVLRKGDNSNKGPAGNDLTVPDVPKPQVKGSPDFYFMGVRLESAPNMTAPAVIEESHSEPLGWLYSIPWGLATGMHNLNRAGEAVMQPVYETVRDNVAHPIRDWQPQKKSNWEWLNFSGVKP